MNDDNILTVSEVTESIKNLFKVNFDKSINVIGELTNIKTSKGNLFCTLKDDSSIISVVIWNYENLKNKPDLDNGRKVIIKGKLTIFSKSGSYKLNASNIELLGVGDLHKEYVKLKEYYSKKGYFNEDRKKKLSLKIEKVGIITAKDGAALQDFLYVLKKNNFNGYIYIKNCLVQGKDCPISVTKCLKLLDEMDLDVIVIARGGGSFEDLFGFSDKKVIETIYNMKTCIISAIGHEVDFMLSDFVADIRAPTPSIAGEIISCKKEGIFSIHEINDLLGKIRDKINIRLSNLENDLLTCQTKLKSPIEIIDNIIQMINTLESKLNNKIKARINNLNGQLNDIGLIINNCHVSDNQCQIMSWNDTVINNKKEFLDLTSKKKKLKIQFIDGVVSFDIRKVH